MSVPILTIPESSFDPASYNNLNTANITKSKSKSKSQSQILLYIIKLTRRSSIGLILFYILGLFIIKPLMELNVTRRKDYLDYIRGKLRDFYLKSITKVQYIPIVAIKINKLGNYILMPLFKLIIIIIINYQQIVLVMMIVMIDWVKINYIKIDKIITFIN